VNPLANLFFRSRGGAGAPGVSPEKGGFGESLLCLLFPPKCPFCGRILNRPGVCAGCRRTLPWTVGAEGEQFLRGGWRCASPLWYEAAAREGLMRFKFRGASGAADALGGLAAECAAERFSGEFDTVTWVPVGAQRLRKRGYDQARLLAESACRRWGVRARHLLVKETENPAQSSLNDAAARRANVLGVYAAAPGAQPEGKRILLVDDIVTTGATLSECARVLRDAGAAEVLCVTVGRTRQKTEKKISDSGGNT